ncbi:MAG: molybdopterin molybdotransferase MoeA [Anaerolineae bacterium]|nr:molybdopterin molybdotransferase MoeA [Anaerolineae bacterium]
MSLISVEEATHRIISGLQRLPAETIALLDALGRVLALDIHAETAMPAHATSSMDGFAVRAADLPQAPGVLKLAADIPAGVMSAVELGPGEAARIMTGAIVPDGADAVVPVEETSAQWAAGESVTLGAEISILRAPRPGDCIRPAGADLMPGQAVLAAGTMLRPPDIGVLAALGHASVLVVRRPVVAILSTGDELAEPGQPLAPAQIYDANSYALTTLVQSWGAVPVRVPSARDTLDSVRAAFHAALAHSPDLVLSSAGVSVGAYDVVRSVIEEFGAVEFWRVNLRPGKPLAFGRISGVSLIGLPGNPVSALVTAELFARPALAALGGWPAAVETVQAAAGEALRSDGRRSYLRVILRREGGGWTAMTTGTQSSSALLSLVLADGLLIIPEGVTEVAPGTFCTVRLLRPLPAAAKQE